MGKSHLPEEEWIKQYQFLKWAREVLSPWVYLYSGLRTLGYDPREDHAPSWSKELIQNG